MKWWMSGAAVTCVGLVLSALLWTERSAGVVRAQEGKDRQRTITTTGMGGGQIHQFGQSRYLQLGLKFYF